MSTTHAMVEGDRLTITVEEAASRLGIGRRLAYTLAADGSLPGVLRLGRRLVVSKAALEASLAPKATSIVTYSEAGPQQAA